MKRKPVLYEKKEDCCGCFACVSSCPKKAIAMEEDEEGFAYPKVNYEICIGCLKCEKVCPIKRSRQKI